MPALADGQGLAVERAMERLSETVLAHRRLVLLTWVVLCLLGGAFALGLPGRIVSGGEAPSSSQSEQVAQAVAESPLPSLFLAVSVPADAPGGLLQQAVISAVAQAGAVEGVTGVSPLPPPPAGDAVDSSSANVAVLSISTSGGNDGAVKAAHALEANKELLVPEGVDVAVGGFGAYRDQLTELSQSDLERAERVGLPIVLVVLFLTFGSLWAAGLPLVIALSALVMGLGAVGVASFFLPMSDFVTNSASMIGIALGVDYAMFMVQRVRELLRTGMVPNDAVRSAMGTTGTAVFWSGITVLAAESTLLLVDSRSIRSAAFGMMMVTIFAVLTSLLVSPVVISLLGSRLSNHGKHARLSGQRGWVRWARHVTSHGALWLVAAAVVLIALSLPSMGLRDNVNISGTSSLPASASVRQAYELASTKYGPAALSPVTVLLPASAQDQAGAVAQAIDADASVASVSTVPMPNGSVVLAVTLTAGPYEPASRTFVESLRSGQLREQLVDVDYQVGGETAASIDATEGMFDSLPKVGIALLIVIGALLLLALRSVFLPVKAVALVLLSLGASLGSLLLLTTTELGATLIGADGPTDIHPIVPVTIIAITVALSTDYEVMLISRIAQEYRETGDNRGSVVTGLARTGGVITSAAVIMIAVFLGFALADLPPLKQLGVGLGLAVLIDATIVRGVMVPATMAVMGRGNWWWPGARTARRTPAAGRTARRRHSSSLTVEAQHDAVADSTSDDGVPQLAAPRL